MWENQVYVIKSVSDQIALVTPYNLEIGEVTEEQALCMLYDK